MRFLPWASSSSATSLSFHHWGEDPTSAANSLPGNHHYFHHGPQPHSVNIEKRNSQLYLFSFYPLPLHLRCARKAKVLHLSWTGFRYHDTMHALFGLVPFAKMRSTSQVRFSRFKKDGKRNGLRYVHVLLNDSLSLAFSISFNH